MRKSTKKEKNNYCIRKKRQRNFTNKKLRTHPTKIFYFLKKKNKSISKNIQYLSRVVLSISERLKKNSLLGLIFLLVHFWHFVN